MKKQYKLYKKDNFLKKQKKPKAYEWVDKETLNDLPEVEHKNKITAEDMNYIKMRLENISNLATNAHIEISELKKFVFSTEKKKYEKDIPPRQKTTIDGVDFTKPFLYTIDGWDVHFYFPQIPSRKILNISNYTYSVMQGTNIISTSGILFDNVLQFDVVNGDIVNFRLSANNRRFAIWQ